jgi:hypothetical protein
MSCIEVMAATSRGQQAALSMDVFHTWQVVGSMPSAATW